MPGSKIGRLCNFLPSALCLGDLWLQPGKRTAGTVSVGRLNQCVVRVLQKPRWEMRLLGLQCGWWRWRMGPRPYLECATLVHWGAVTVAFACVCARARAWETLYNLNTWKLTIRLLMETLSTETSFSYHMLLTAFFAPKHHRSALYFLRKVEDGFCSSVVRGCRGGSGRETKGTLLT